MLNIALLLVLVFTGLLYQRLRQQSAQLASTYEEVTRLQTIIDEYKKGDAECAVEEPAMRLSIKVNNPMVLAKRESKAAKFVGDLLPDLIEQKVYEQVRDEIAVGLKEKDVDAEIKIEVY
ncbi:MAG: hypothetical protein H6999_10885 [Hahellaceae bacterium]|nr:hypothetical protein [Hahellaceae bacterium]